MTAVSYKVVLPLCSWIACRQQTDSLPQTLKMKSQLFASLFSLFLLFGLSLADSLRTKKPLAPGLDLLYSANITGGESVIVAGGPRGTRIISPILGGSFAGPKLKGNNPSLHSLFA